MEIIQIRNEINKIDNRKTMEGINITKIDFYKNSKKLINH